MGAFGGTLMKMAEAGVLPDPLVRLGIRNLLSQRLKTLPESPSTLPDYTTALIDEMDSSPVALCTQDANEQHYELPPAYFELVLGSHKKYSACYWPQGCQDLGRAEAASLTATCDRAQINDGQRILELGCGWGSLTLWMAKHYPNARITAVSNSATQRQWILEQLKICQLNNVSVITADMNSFAPADSGSFDRVVSLEMFEHMRNWRLLFSRVASWLKEDGKFFMHVFCHRNAPYFFADTTSTDDRDWMGRYFFAGGLMPSFDLPLSFQEDLSLKERWQWNGEHYSKTLLSWLQKHDANKESIMSLFGDVYGDQAAIWFQRWRMFYLACAELFAFNDGSEWFVGHYLFSRRRVADV